MQLGIDIGTDMARAACLDAEGCPQLVCLPGGAEGLPAMARQTMHGLEVGDGAARALAGNVETTICGPTRLMGRAGQLSPQLLERLPYPVREVDGEAVCNLLYAEVRPSQALGLLVWTLVDAAERSLAKAVDGVALTVPASAEDRYRVQIRAAVEARGVRVRRLINQPTAALLAVGLDPAVRHVAVVNCGGGSTDVSVAERGAEGIRILATAGDMLLGGDDLAWAAAEGINGRFRQAADLDVFGVGDSRMAALGLRAAAKEALQTLSITPQITLTLDHGGGFGRDLATVVHRAEVDAWLAPYMERVGTLCGQALAASGLIKSHIQVVVLTGDWAHLPLLRETIAEAFRKPVTELHTEKAAWLPAFGAALAAAGEAPLVWDVTPYALGINCYYDEVELFSPIVPANTSIPTPVLGAAGAFTERYWTRHPDQTSVRFDVLQYRGPRTPDPYGDGPVRPNECEVLGSWTFSDLHPEPGRQVPFTVTFAVDADGILHLHAEETATGHHLTASVERGIG